MEEKHNLKLHDFGLIELNEAFAAQVLACDRELNFNRDRLNVNGGAIAIGHPIGCTGTRITVTLLHEMLKRNTRRGVATSVRQRRIGDGSRAGECGVTAERPFVPPSAQLGPPDEILTFPTNLASAMLFLAPHSEVDVGRISRDHDLRRLCDSMDAAWFVFARVADDRTGGLAQEFSADVVNTKSGSHGQLSKVYASQGQSAVRSNQ